MIIFRSQEDKFYFSVIIQFKICYLIDLYLVLF